MTEPKPDSTLASVSPAPPPAGGSSRLFWRLVALTAVLKLFFAAAIPITGDEAYFVTWGRFPDYGYYDHGAMTGWWISAMLLLGQAAWIVRLPAVFAPLVVAVLLRRALRPLGTDRADLAATLFVLSPVNVANVFMTTDTPLLLFSMLAVVWASRGEARGRIGDWFVAGLFLGAGFLAKYFAVLLGVGFAAYLLVRHRARGWRRLAALLAGVAPWAATNIAWNYHHGWVNILFNVFNRNTDTGLSLGHPLLFVVLVAALAGPGLVWFALRPRRQGRLSLRAALARLRETRLDVFAFAAFVPLGLLFVVSLGQKVGLHWLISFYPLAFAVVAAVFEPSVLRRLLRPMAWYSAVPAALFAVLPFVPVEWAHKHKSYTSIVIGTHPDEVAAALAPYATDYQLTSPSYAKAAVLGFYRGETVPVLGPGSFHARQDDIVTDFRAFAGKNLMVFSDKPALLEPARAWFDDAETREIEVRGARLTLLLGRGFRYDVYREQVLRPVAETYYAMPAWLARIAAPCFFTERYGFGEQLIRNETASSGP